MDRSLRSRLLLVGILLAAGCGGDRDRGGPLQPDDSAATVSDTVHFAAAGLDSAIRAALGNPQEPLTTEQVLTLTQLDARKRGIADLTGIEYLRNLTALDLSYNAIRDPAPLASLTRLQYLDLSGNQIVGFSALRDLPALQLLDVSSNLLNVAARSEVIRALRARGVTVVE